MTDYWLHLSVALALCIGVPACGDKASTSDNKARLSWEKGEAALKSPNIKTIADYYSRLSELNTSDTRRRYYSDPKSLEEFVSMEEYVDGICGRDPMQTPASAREEIAKKLTWKKKDAKIDDAKRNYLLSFSRNTVAETLATWDRPISVYIFTDGDGEILGWQVID